MRREMLLDPYPVFVSTILPRTMEENLHHRPMRTAPTRRNFFSRQVVAVECSFGIVLMPLLRLLLPYQLLLGVPQLLHEIRCWDDSPLLFFTRIIDLLVILFMVNTMAMKMKMPPKEIHPTPLSITPPLLQQLPPLPVPTPTPIRATTSTPQPLPKHLRPSHHHYLNPPISHPSQTYPGTMIKPSSQQEVTPLDYGI